MYCKYCGKPIDGNYAYCSACGKYLLSADENPQNFEPLERFGFLNAIKSFYKNYSNFKGRARRSEYWWFVLYYYIINTVCMLPMFVFGILSEVEDLYIIQEEIMGIMALVYCLVVPIFNLAHFIPNISLTVRRFHDIGKSGACYFFSFIPYAGSFIMLYYMCKKSSYYDNQWGPSPYKRKSNKIEPNIENKNDY